MNQQLKYRIARYLFHFNKNINENDKQDILDSLLLYKDEIIEILSEVK
jgi:hypothetical protein